MRQITLEKSEQKVPHFFLLVFGRNMLTLAVASSDGCQQQFLVYHTCQIVRPPPAATGAAEG